MTQAPFHAGKAIGIDVSASRQAGRLTWIATISDPGIGPTLESVIPAAQLVGGAMVPEAVFPALAEWIAVQPQAIVGIDSPFGLPLTLVVESDWTAFVAGFPRRFPDPDGFRATCQELSANRELKRACDLEARTPFAAYNLRLYRQTWWVIGCLLNRLVTAGRARAAPMQPPAPDLPLLIEACPASLLKRLGMYRPYKGNAAHHSVSRRDIADALMLEGLRLPQNRLRSIVTDSGGDALDAVVAAWAAWRAAADKANFEPRNEADRLEARVYF